MTSHVHAGTCRTKISLAFASTLHAEGDPPSCNGTKKPKRTKTWKPLQSSVFLLRFESSVDPYIDDPEQSRRKRTINALIDAVYPGVDDNNLPDEYFVERAALARANASVRRLNDMVAEQFSGETKGHLSADSLEGIADPNMFEPEFLNSLNFSGIPPPRIALKVGVPVIMIHSLTSAAGLCNGTRLRVVSLRERSIEATIMSGPFKGTRVFIPRIIFNNEDDDKEFSLKLRCKQFPVAPAFAMTINKAQRQSIYHVGVYLESLVLAHGQLYVALSRVTSRKAIKTAVDPEFINEEGNMHTKNIVYREIFDF